MKIGIDARFYGSLGKGLGRYTQKLIHYLEELDDTNEYVVFLRKENFDEYRPRSRRFRKALADYAWYSFEEQLLFPWLLRRYRLDLVHFPHFNIPVLYRGRFVVTIHDLILLHFPTRRASTLPALWYWVKFWAYRMTIRHAILRSERIVTVSEFTKSDLLERYWVSPDKIQVTYEAAESFCFFKSRGECSSVLRRLGLWREESSLSRTYEKYGIIQPYLLYVGNAYPHKNLEALVLLMKQINQVDMQLVLVGKEDYFYRRLKEYIQEQGVKNIRLVGFVPDDELDVLYRFARAYVFPSLYEGFGLPPLEAMSKGLPVVAARAASLPEILGDAAFFFEPNDPRSFETAVKEVWQNEVLRAQLREKGYRQAEKFSWRTMAQKTLDIYQEITKSVV
jgi:glycosyltransferase involved in cell wall biosynthesis